MAGLVEGQGLAVRLLPDGAPPAIAVLGAHCDDIELGAGATLLTLAQKHPGLRVSATVLSSTPERAAETRASLAAFLPGADLDLEIFELPDGRLPSVWNDAKELVEQARRRAGGVALVFSPWRGDAHQDHRLLAELIPTAFRAATVLQYEILKSDNDLGRPAVHVPVAAELAQRKWQLLHEHYPSQRGRGWFDEEALLGLMRVRGVGCGARYAEAFHTDKLIVEATA